jgi:hypothetical protein
LQDDSVGNTNSKKDEEERGGSVRESEGYMFLIHAFVIRTG